MMAIERPFRGARQHLRSKLGGLWPLHLALRRWAPRLPCLVEGCLPSFFLFGVMYTVGMHTFHFSIYRG